MNGGHKDSDVRGSSPAPCPVSPELEESWASPLWGPQTSLPAGTLISDFRLAAPREQTVLSEPLGLWGSVRRAPGLPWFSCWSSSCRAVKLW